MQSDNELLEQTARGHEDAFLTLYRRHHGSVFRFALHMSGKQEIAEEVVQEVFLQLLSAPGRFQEGQGALQGYLIGVARNLVRSRFKQDRRFTSDLPQLAADARVLDHLTGQETLRDLRAAILRLPPNYREAVVLCDIEGLDYETVAGHLGCPLGTVRSRLHRARALLASRLRKQIGCTA